MTDNRTTELREKLTERGIEWKDGDAAYETEWSTPDGRHCSAMYWKPTFTVLVSGCTPEQAIAASLGSGTLTAEQVEDIVYRNTEFYEGGDVDVQAITDELNAELGSGKCEPDEDGYCPYCGEDLVRCDVGIGEGGGAVELDPPVYYNYCPNCGRRVKL